MGVNGFGRIGRLVTRIIADDADCDMKLINAGSATADYMAYQFKYDTIHGKFNGSVETEGDFLIINGKKVPTTRCRDPAEAGWGKLGADYVCEVSEREERINDQLSTINDQRSMTKAISTR